MNRAGYSERLLRIHDAGPCDRQRSFADDALQATRVASDGCASLRWWSRPEPVISLGRFQRRSPEDPTLERRLSGGRAVPLGPGILCATGVFPDVSWLDPASPGLRPDQVLNRALRPFLTAGRNLGADLFYPGRDLVTALDRTVAHASWTVTADGLCVVEVQLAVERSPDFGGQLLAGPGGQVSGDDGSAWSGGACLRDVVSGAGAQALSTGQFLEVASAALAEEYRCEVSSAALEEGAAALRGPARAPNLQAVEDFDASVGPLRSGHASACGFGMLGLVECSARLHADRLHDVEVTGAVIAPFATIDGLSERLEGQPYRMPSIRRALSGVLSRPRSFLLGVLDLDEILGRMG